MIRSGILVRLIGDRRGSMAIETAFVAPILATLALGSFEIGSLVSRQHELQTAASEGESIALAAAAGATLQISTLEDILETSMDLDDEDVAVALRYRCNDQDALQTAVTSCDEDDTVSSYVRIDVSDTYVPVWTKFGVGEPIDLSVERLVQIS